MIIIEDMLPKNSYKLNKSNYKPLFDEIKSLFFIMRKHVLVMNSNDKNLGSGWIFQGEYITDTVKTTHKMSRGLYNIRDITLNLIGDESFAQTIQVNLTPWSRSDSVNLYKFNKDSLLYVKKAIPDGPLPVQRIFWITNYSLSN